MKNLFLLAFLLYVHSALAVAPYGIKGQAQTQTLYSNVHQFPNQNVTNIGGINALVYDSGLIYDGGFESATAFQGHTIVNGGAYFAVVTTAANVLDGKKTARVTCFSATPGTDDCEIEQTVSLGTTRLLGFPMLLSVRVDTPADQPLTFCAKIDGVKKDCVTGYKGYLTIPTQAGASSVGYTLTKTSTPTPLNSFFDSIKVEITETITNAPVVGPRVAYTPTFTGFGTVTNVNCYGQQIGPNELVDCTFTAGTTTATEARVSLRSGLTSNSGLPTTSHAGYAIVSGATPSQHVVIKESSVTYVTFGLQGTSNAGLTKLNGNAFLGSGNTISFQAIVPIAQYQSSVPTYSDRCRDPLACEYVLTAKIDKTSGTPVVSQENVDWIDSCSNLSTGQMRCTIKAGVSTLPLNCSGSENILSSQTIHSFNMTSNTQFDLYTLGRQDAATYANVVSGITCVKQGQDYVNAKVNQIVGSFKDYVRTPNTATGKVGFCSAKISATGVISDQLGGCFASCTNATTPVCTFTSNYWRSGSIPNCWHTGGTSFLPANRTVTSTTYSGIIANNSGGPAASGDREYFCHGEIQ